MTHITPNRVPAPFPLPRPRRPVQEPQFRSSRARFRHSCTLFCHSREGGNLEATRHATTSGSGRTVNLTSHDPFSPGVTCRQWTFPKVSLRTEPAPGLNRSTCSKNTPGNSIDTPNLLPPGPERIRTESNNTEQTHPSKHGFASAKPPTTPGQIRPNLTKSDHPNTRSSAVSARSRTLPSNSLFLTNTLSVQSPASGSRHAG